MSTSLKPSGNEPGNAATAAGSVTSSWQERCEESARVQMGIDRMGMVQKERGGERERERVCV